MNLNHVHFNQCENLSQEKTFTSGQIFNKFHTVVAKSTTSRRKLNTTEANTSTPKNNRAFFVCSTRTPQENRLAVFLSMVERSGQSLLIGCYPLWAVFHPVTFYRQTVESLAVDSENITKESIKMNPYTLNAYTGNQFYTLLNTTRSISDLGGIYA